MWFFLAQDLDRKYDLDLDNLSRNQKKEIEKLEVTQNADLRTSSRKMKQDQVRFSWGQVWKMLRQFTFSYVTIQVFPSSEQLLHNEQVYTNKGWENFDGFKGSVIKSK